MAWGERRMNRDIREILEEVWPDYVLGRVLGRGSFATVYEATRRDGVASTPSAIKVVPVPTSENEVEELRMEGLTGERTEEYFQIVVDDYKREIKLMDELRTDPHVVSIEDYKVYKVPDEMLWYIFIRMPKLTPLRTEMEKWPREGDTEDRIVKLGTDLCKALESCQRYRIVHRDIKPENIFVTPQGDFCLGDFGVARNLVQTTRGLSRKGTPNYMAPELYKGEILQDFHAGSLVDQYSVGMVLYYAANGMCLPFYPSGQQVISADLRDTAFIRRINGETLPPPEKVSPGLQEIILRALSHAPENRYAAPGEMRKALEEYDRDKQEKTNGGSAETRDETQNTDHREGVTPLRPSGRRRRLIVAAVCLIVLLGVGVWQYPNIRDRIWPPTSVSVPEEFTGGDPVARDRFIMARLKEEGLAWPVTEEELSAALKRLPSLKGYLYVGKKGDLNGDGGIDVRDLVILQKVSQENDEVIVVCYANGDMDGDGEITGADLALLREEVEK